MRSYCWTCHRPTLTCFCALVRPFESFAEFALIVHPMEARSSVGTAWILRRSISNLQWCRSNGIGLDSDPHFLEILSTPDRAPLLLFPGSQAFNLSNDAEETWGSLVSNKKRPLFIVIDGTWSQAHSILRKSTLLRSLPRVSFETIHPSEYGFKKQPNRDCLSSVEGVHRVIEILAFRGWVRPPALREHHQMIQIFRDMVKFQFNQNKNPSRDSPVVPQHPHVSTTE